MESGLFVVPGGFLVVMAVFLVVVDPREPEEGVVESVGSHPFLDPKHTP